MDKLYNIISMTLYMYMYLAESIQLLILITSFFLRFAAWDYILLGLPEQVVAP